MSNNIYFAADKAEETINYLEDKANGWYNHIQKNGLLMKMVTSWAYYYGQFYDNSHDITFAGESGELLSMPIAHYRNIAQHILVNITGSRPAFTCTAVNGDRKSLIQAQLGNGILSYYMRTARFERKFKKATEYSIVMGTGYLLTEWNGTKGRLIGRNDINEDLIESYDEETNEPLDIDGAVVNGTPIFAGDITCRVLSPLDVLFDFTKDDPELNDWYLARVFINKFDLIAKYPELKQQLLAIETKNAMTKRICLTPYNETTDIPVYLFFHRSTESLPEGRMIMYADRETVMEDAILPYPDLPIQRISPSDILGSSFGYTPMFDLLPIQDAINSVYSTVLTNHNAFGVQNILNPIGNNVKFTQISDGMNWIDYDASEGKPEALQLTKSSPESYNLIGLLEKVMETISGVNSVSRGNPEASLKSGTALALVQAQSLQYMTGLQQSYIQLLEDAGTFMINLLKEFADEPRIVSIAGINNSQRIKQFNNDDIVAIDRVTVDVGNAIMACLAKDTPVLMFDGTFKMSQDIKVGDKVMGPDSQVRTVEAKGQGQEEMFEVRSKRTKELVYTANRSHIMTLRYCSDDTRYNAKKGDVIDITINDYLALPERQQRLLMGFRTKIDYSKKELPIDPYIFGTWLGDGDNSRAGITSMDSEIIESWKVEAESRGLKFKKSKSKSSGKASSYQITSGKQNGSALRNSFINDLHTLNVYKNKHIPHIYMTSSEEDRLQLLAGLIDTDGTLAQQTFVFYQKCPKIAHAVVSLARSLGFYASIKEESRVCSFNNKVSYFHIITIGGDTWRIPTRIERKKVEEVSKNSNWLNYGIELVSIGKGTYYGFTLEEEPHFVLGDYTVTHNTHAGRWQVAENLLQMGLIKTPEKLLQLLNTGNLESLIDGTTNELDVINTENEALLMGEPVIAIALDAHAMHIREHKSVLSDPVLRFDKDLVERTLAHINEHIVMLRETDPTLLAINGEQPVGPIGGSPNAPTQPSTQSTDIAPQMQIQDQVAGVPNLPQPAKPPGQFENMPQTPEQLMAQQG
jgi:hypothetical protein